MGEEMQVSYKDVVKYNGWTNYATWNVALWMQNDEAFADIARGCNNYEEFKAALIANPPYHGETAVVTPDDILWSDPDINVDEINSSLWSDND